jgi:CRISPR-associated exonuclease Cas4
MLRVTDLKQWAYCRRIVYYQHRMPGAGAPTYKMQEGRRAQELIERLEVRRTLREYGLDAAERRFGLWLEDQRLGLAGKLDLLLDAPDQAAIVEFKLTSGEVGDNHRLQLAGYALLVTSVLAKPVARGFIYRIPDGRIFPVEISAGLLSAAARAATQMREMIEAGWLPEPAPVKGRCHECEYANFCADIW